MDEFRYLYKGKPVEVEIQITGDHKVDTARADAKMKATNPEWKKRRGQVWHHGPRGKDGVRMQLIPESVNKVCHIGTAADARAAAGISANAVGAGTFLVTEVARAQDRKTGVPVDAPWVFIDSSGRPFHVIEQRTSWFHKRRYYKYYFDKPHPTMDYTDEEFDELKRQGKLEEIDAQTGERLREEGKIRWGYMRRNWKLQWEFVPGTQRKELPVRYLDEYGYPHMLPGPRGMPPMPIA
jgi:hypothetical protein